MKITQAQNRSPLKARFSFARALGRRFGKRIFLAPLLVLMLIPAKAAGGIFSSQNNKDLVAIFEALEASGPQADTVEELRRYIERNPYAESTDEALLRLARIYSQGRELSRAIDAYQRLIENYPASKFRFDALYELGSLRFKEGSLNDAKSLLEAVSSNKDATITLRARAQALLKDIGAASYATAARAGAIAIGALLPLKGGYSQFGEDALKGVLLAAGAFGGTGQPVEVYVRDVGADPAESEKAIGELASNQRVAGLVGPLLSAAATETAESAQRKRIPVIILSQKEGVTGAGDYVFRNSLSPSAQAAAIASYATRTFNGGRYAVIYPQNNYGMELAKLFEQEVKKGRGAVVKEASYQSGTRDFSDLIRQTFGVAVKERKEGRRKIKEYTPALSVDGVFIPDFYETVSLIAPYFEYYNIKGTQLLGTNGWNSPKLIELAGKNVEGAVFVDGFFPGHGRPGTEEFVSGFIKAYGRPPGVIEAQAYDAAMLLISSAAGTTDGSPDREALKHRLKTRKDFTGAAGTISFDGNREAVRELFILTVRDGRIVEAGGL